MANEYGDSELVHVNKYEMEQLRQMWGEPGINPETGLPAYGFFSFVKKAVTTVAKIGATIALTPVLGPVGASAAVNAVSTAIGGGDLGDIVKSAGFAAATAEDRAQMQKQGPMGHAFSLASRLIGRITVRRRLSNQ